MCMWLSVCVLLCRGYVGISILVLIDKCSATKAGAFQSREGWGSGRGYSSVKQFRSTHQFTREGSIYKKVLHHLQLCCFPVGRKQRILSRRSGSSSIRSCWLSTSFSSREETKRCSCSSVRSCTGWQVPLLHSPAFSASPSMRQGVQGSGCLAQVRVLNGQAVTELFPCFRGRGDYFCSNLPL